MTRGGTPQAKASFEIAERFKAAVQKGNAEAVAAMIAEGFDFNAQDAEDGMAALHHAAAFGARGCIRVLVKSGKCDYLLEDKHGRAASELAYEWGRDYAVGRLLSKKQAMAHYCLTQSQVPSP